MTDDHAPHAFADLTPDSILDAVESIGFRIDASLLELNSYENRVYQIGIEDEAPIIAKFYRAERWSDAEINEEHAFSFDLFDEELSVVPPIQRSIVSFLSNTFLASFTQSTGVPVHS